jgi:hypothetical protein
MSGAREPIPQQEFLRRLQLVNLSTPGIRRANNRQQVLTKSLDRPVIVSNTTSNGNHYERLSRGKPQFDKFVIKAQESRTREDIEIENRFEDGVKRITAIHRDKRFQPLQRRTPLLIERDQLPLN